nr:MAG TPA: hypothetical protein [Caudoviricetes sp.]
MTNGWGAEALPLKRIAPNPEPQGPRLCSG